MNRSVPTLLMLLPCLTAGCNDAPTGAGWRFRFAEPGLGARAQLVETEIRRGGCDGESAFTTKVSPTSSGDAAPELAKGRYGFRGRARDADCTWFAEGCAEATLPHSGAIEIVLDRSMFPGLDPDCVPGEQTGDPATGADAGSADGGSEGPKSDAGLVDPDAGPAAPFDPSAPKCANLESTVIACFDFADTLADASTAVNDATSNAPPAFESGLSGNAIRVGRRHIAVADAASLNVSAFTVEMWLRPDRLVNLDDQVNDVSLLLDKDQQYNVGFTSRGELRMQVYRGVNDSETTTAGAPTLPVGQFAYVAFSYDGTRSAIYNNGQRIDGETIGLDLFRGNGGPMHIGSGSPDGTRPYDGLIDAVRISNLARTDAEICASAGKVLEGGTCK